MRNAGATIEEGAVAYRAGATLDDCPYEGKSEDEIFQEGYHGAEPIGLVRVDIDYRNLWEIGWKIANQFSRKADRDGRPTRDEASR